jgi:hypothetical protein
MKRLWLAAFIYVATLASAQAATPWPSECIQPIAFGTPVNGTLTKDDCAFYFTSAPADLYYTDIYTFSGKAGQRIVITMDSTAGDAWIDFYDVNDIDAETLDSDNDGGGGTNARIPANSGYFTLPSTGTYYISANTYLPNQTGPYTIALTTPDGGDTSPPVITVTEFYHPEFDHYFITAYPDEAASLAAGNLPPWVPTGRTFEVWGSAGTNISQVWRFFSATFAPKSSHFYTGNSTEAQALRSGGVWTQEADSAFFMMPSPTGTCPTGTIPLYRLYNNGQGGAPNHRYTTDPALRTQMIAAAWVPEGNGKDGVFACVPAI